jgi:hypothetical protein
MRNLKTLSLTLILVAVANTLTHAAIFGEENISKKASLKKPCEVALIKRHFVHATLHNGKIIPNVLLPVVTISAERNTKNIIPATETAHAMIGVVDLPEIVVTGKRKTSAHKLRNASGKNGIIPAMDLPEIVISAERIKSNSFAWQEANDNKIPVVNLPEVIISADFPQHDMMTAVIYKGEFIASVYLPEVEITADKPENLIVSNNYGGENQNVDFNSVSFEKSEAKMSPNLNRVILILAKTIFFKF